jgi:hypothetical protein
MIPTPASCIFGSEGASGIVDREADSLGDEAAELNAGECELATGGKGELFGDNGGSGAYWCRRMYACTCACNCKVWICMHCLICGEHTYNDQRTCGYIQRGWE